MSSTCRWSRASTFATQTSTASIQQSSSYPTVLSSHRTSLIPRVPFAAALRPDLVGRDLRRLQPHGGVGADEAHTRASPGFARRCQAGTTRHVAAIALTSTSTITLRRFVAGSMASSTTHFGSEIPRLGCSSSTHGTSGGKVLNSNPTLIGTMHGSGRWLLQWSEPTRCRGLASGEPEEPQARDYGAATSVSARRCLPGERAAGSTHSPPRAP